ncbi:hypothetical protein [Streptomyces sp. NBC_01538]|uniref:hypothetical protein n=1 Tax=Streptomyces sp. NBC_01538 TaxID=2903897 RepID=UPI00386D9DCF
MDDLVFEDPPAPRKTNPAYEAVAEALRKRPREWARVGAFPSASMIACNIKRGRPKVFEPAGAFDAVSRKVEDETVLYVQYVGETKDSEEPS